MERDIPQEECDIHCAIDEMLYTGRMPERLAIRLRNREMGRFIVSLEEVADLDQAGHYEETE